MGFVAEQLRLHPELVLFLSLSIGYLIGQLKMGRFQLGGICGALLVALVLGQSGARLSADLKNIAFALFIFALGFSGGPQFFANITRGWRYAVLSFVELIVVMTLVLLAVWAWQMDVGTAAGLLAGAATESAVVGTAAEAIGRLPLQADEVRRLQANIATAYSVTYLFGLVSIVLFTTQVAPRLLGIRIEDEARRLWGELQGTAQDKHSEHVAAPALVGRVFLAGKADGQTVQAIERALKHGISIERVRSQGQERAASPDMVVRADDELLLVGRRTAMIQASERLGDEIASDMQVPMEERDVLLTRKDLHGLPLGQVLDTAAPELRRGAWANRLIRQGAPLPCLPHTKVERGDVLRLYGTPRAVGALIPHLGSPTAPAHQTDYVVLGMGVLLGIALGSLSLPLWGSELTLGTGGGCLVSGLVFGWARSRMPRLGNLPSPAAEVLKDFGLATFIVCVGLSAGPDALALIQTYGWKLPAMGILVSLAPAVTSLAIGRMMNMEPVILLGAIAGQHVSTPAISALVERAGNSSPMLGYTVTYAVSNGILPLAGPLLVMLAGLIHH